MVCMTKTNNLLSTQDTDDHLNLLYTQVNMWFFLLLVLSSVLVSDEKAGFIKTITDGNKVDQKIDRLWTRVEPPYNNTDYLPQSPQHIDPQLLLYTRTNRKTPKILSFTNRSSLVRANFDVKKPVKIAIHGFLSHADNWVDDAETEFLNYGDFNVIEVDWSKGAGLPYGQAVSNVRLVAKIVKLLIDLLVKEGVILKNVHIVGHSLGAHMAGQIGHMLGGKMGRITALDPAGLDFESLDPLLIVDKSDAMFVDVIHTDGGDLNPLERSGYGLFEAVGHVDFYPNGGMKQPGCDDIIDKIEDIPKFGLGHLLACNHYRSHEIFTDSINSYCSFNSFPCGNYEDFEKGECASCGQGGCGVMGYSADKFQGRGKQYLKTRGKELYCGYQYKVVATLAKPSNMSGTLYVKFKGAEGFTTTSGSLQTSHAKKDGITLEGVVVLNRIISEIKIIHAHLKSNGKHNRIPFTVTDFEVTRMITGDSHKVETGSYTLSASHGVDMRVHIESAVIG